MHPDEPTDELKPAHCPLLKDHAGLPALLAAFNKAAGLLRDARARFPAAFQGPKAVPALVGGLASLAAARERLIRPRYLMGFLGTSQAGKSSTFNNVLKAVNDPPAVSGAGVATTSAITRLYALPPGSTPVFTLHYLSEEEYRDRRETLCDRLAYANSHDKDDREVYDELATHEPTGDRWKPDDKPFLRRFIRTHIEYAGKLVVPGQAASRTEDYARRKDFLNHGEDDRRADPKPEPNLMIAEATVGYPTDEIAPELEMIDCPGLGAAKSVDTVLTKAYIRKLDGALLFLRADQIQSGDAVEILQALRETFPNGLVGRVWVVVNKFDVPTRDAKLIGNSGLTTFDHIARLLREWEIPPGQVCLTCNAIHDYARKSPDGVAPRSRALDKLNLTEDGDADHPAITRHPHLHESFGHLLTDGGIGRLRELVKTTVAQSVADAIRQDADAVLTALVPRLERAIEAISRPLDREQAANAERWWNKLQLLALKLERRDPAFDAFAGPVRSELEKHLGTGDPDVLALIHRANPDYLSAQFKITVRNLDEGMHTAIDNVVDRAYEAIRQDLSSLKDVRLPASGTGVRDELVRFQTEDAGRDWRGDFPTFAAPGLIDRLRPTGDQYLGLMREKCRTAAGQALQLVRQRLRMRVRSLIDEVQTLIFAADGE